MTGNVCSGCICVSLVTAEMLLPASVITRVQETRRAGPLMSRDYSSRKSPSTPCIRSQLKSPARELMALATLESCSNNLNNAMAQDISFDNGRTNKLCR